MQAVAIRRIPSQRWKTTLQMQISSTHFVVFSGIFFAETRVSHTPNAQMTMSIGGAGRQEAIARIPQHSSDSFYTGYVETSEWLISELHEARLSHARQAGRHSIPEPIIVQQNI